MANLSNPAYKRVSLKDLFSEKMRKNFDNDSVENFETHNIDDCGCGSQFIIERSINRIRKERTNKIYHKIDSYRE